MSESKSYAETVNVWEEGLAALDGNIEDLPQAEIPRQKLRSILTQIRGVAARQSALTADRQEATKELYILLAQGRKLTTLLRTIIREHYGNRSEKLAEFNVQPLRGRRRNPEITNPAPE